MAKYSSEAVNGEVLSAASVTADGTVIAGAVRLRAVQWRNVATAGRKSGTVIQALRHIGQRNVNDKTLAILKRQLTTQDRAQLLKDLRHAPGWVADIMRQLAS